MEDRKLLLRRVTAGLDAMFAQDQVDVTRVAAMGYCFGGLCVLDLARSGAEIAGVVSFHALLDSPALDQGSGISAKVLVLHGYDDPMVLPDMVQKFQQMCHLTIISMLEFSLLHLPSAMVY